MDTTTQDVLQINDVIRLQHVMGNTYDVFEVESLLRHGYLWRARITIERIEGKTHIETHAGAIAPAILAAIELWASMTDHIHFWRRSVY